MANHPSRLTHTAQALEAALAGLADALTRVDYDVMANSETTLHARVQAFRVAAADAVSAGESLSPADADTLVTAMARCRRLGGSLLQLTGAPASFDAPGGYTPVGQLHASVDGGAYLTARG